MNKSALKKFAISMRLELISLVKIKIDFLLSDAYKNNLALYNTNKSHIQQIEDRYVKDGKDFIEEVAYTWFNRFIALRFMDVNEITSISVISTTDEQPIPQILVEAKSGNIQDSLKLNKELFFDLIDKKISGVKDSDNEAYKMLFVATCNDYANLMPSMFEKISDYTELLLPEDMLSSNSIRAKVVNSMSEEDCQDIEVIGWLYQFYISEKKDDVFAQLKQNKKITPSNIPAATQLFTPHWIVKYMVENSLGKLWMLNNPNSSLKENMKYYIENEEETTTFIKIEKPEDITFLDPCVGSGHTLTYAFDLLTMIYEEEGYNKSDIPALILEHNLFGCDIDKRASVLANFALTMKARQYHKRFFNKNVKPNIVELEEYGSEFTGIKNFGSLLIPNSTASFDDGIFSQNTREYEIQKKILSSEFHCVVTNPPYKDRADLNDDLQDFLITNYCNSKQDLFAAFIERCCKFSKDLGYIAMITLQNWMYLDSFNDFRKYLISNIQIDKFIHIGYNSFPELNSKFALAISFVLQNKKPISNGVYYNLNDVGKSEDKEVVFFNKVEKNEAFYVNQSNFLNMPKNALAYLATEQQSKLFVNTPNLKTFAVINEGLKTRDNERFLRLWFENNNKDYNINWQPYCKGGEFRKWYGNHEYVLKWHQNGREIKEFKKSSGTNFSFYFTNTLVFKSIGYEFGTLFTNKSIFGGGGSGITNINENLFYYISAFTNSKLSILFLNLLSTTLNFEVGNIGMLPIVLTKHKEIQQKIETLTKQNINISKEEWDARETSWDFKKNELLKHKTDTKIETAYLNYCNYWREQFNTLHQNEEELNRLFIDIYELQDELTPEVELKDITILKSETKKIDKELVFQADEIMKQLISYGVGVMFGRYSLDSDGLLIANMGQEIPTSTTFEIDDDNIIPVLEDDYFKDDIASRFVQFVKATFGEENLPENIRFIENSIGTTIRKYFVKNFYEDHIKRYQKRPIYWMVTSPKKGFMSLIYMHRYEADTFARVRNSYLTEYITKLEAHKETLGLTITSETASDKDKKDADKQIKDIDTKLKELIAFDRDKMMSMSQNTKEIDLDDGVKINYCKFEDILYPIVGLCK